MMIMQMRSENMDLYVPEDTSFVDPAGGSCVWEKYHAHPIFVQLGALFELDFLGIPCGR